MQSNYRLRFVSPEAETGAERDKRASLGITLWRLQLHSLLTSALDGTDAIFTPRQLYPL
jgi:hypothetical protein